MLGNLVPGLLSAPAWARRALSVVLIASLLVIAWFIWLHLHETAVIERHQSKIQQQAAPASEKAAEERADDALRNASLRAERDAAIAEAEAAEAAKAPEVRATLPPTTVALNCTRMQQAYTASELAKMVAYRERCL